MTLKRESRDSFSIGSAASGVSLVVYFDNILDDGVVEKIDRAIQLWKNSSVQSGRVK